MNGSPIEYRLGIDVGGTFIDFALCDAAGEMTVHKVAADPAHLAAAIMRGIADLAEQRGTDERTFLGRMDLVVHGTTVATNAVLTGTGSRTGLLTTKGTRDALEMRRGVKEEPLDNKYEAPPPLGAALPEAPGRRAGGLERQRHDRAGCGLAGGGRPGPENA